LTAATYAHLAKVEVFTESNAICTVRPRHILHFRCHRFNLFFCARETSEFVKENPDLAKLLLQQGTKHPTSQEGFRHQYDAVLRFNTQARLQQIEVPTLVLQGKKDRLVPPENGSILAKAIPNAKLVFFEKSAHVVVEEMEEVLKVITEFLL